MAESQSKIDAAADKAFAEAAEKKTADAVNAKAVEKAVEADTTAPVKADAVAKAVAAEPKKAPPPSTPPARTCARAKHAQPHRRGGPSFAEFYCVIVTSDMTNGYPVCIA